MSFTPVLPCPTIMYPGTEIHHPPTTGLVAIAWGLIRPACSVHHGLTLHTMEGKRLLLQHAVYLPCIPMNSGEMTRSDRCKQKSTFACVLGQLRMLNAVDYQSYCSVRGPHRRLVCVLVIAKVAHLKLALEEQMKHFELNRI